jgi:7-carboxy-7-deazaguanine synthase
MDSLSVSEIFRSIQGESTRAGVPCAFVRLAGCNLHCAWCDTPYALRACDGQTMPLEEILRRVRDLATRCVEVTGGEPLTQDACPKLLARLCDEGLDTLLETNGSLDISKVDSRVVRIVDFKCPSSGQMDRNLWSNVEQLTARDEVKLVLANREDFEFAVAVTRKHDLPSRCGAVLLSPVHGRLAPAELARWILDEALDVRLGLQLHKMIWPDRDRGV